MRRLVVLALLFGAMKLIEPLGAPDSVAAALLTFGFLILAAYAAGELARSVRLPKVVGYILAGVLSGPTVLGTVTIAAADRLAPVSSLAIALIAFLAGSELDLAELRRRGAALVRLTLVELGLALVVLSAAILVLRRWIPFLDGTTMTQAVVLTLIFGLIAVMHSPAIVMALLTEMRAHGPASRATLATVLLSEVVLVLLFSVLLGATQGLLPGSAAVHGGVGKLVWEIAGSVPIGLLFGAAVGSALRVVRDDRLVFALLAAMLGQQVAALLHVEVLITLLVAGFVAVNTAPGDEGVELRRAMERAAVPVFVVFFALAGVTIDLPMAARVAPVVVPLVLLRVGALQLGVRLGSRGLDLSPEGRQALWQGLVAQAGVAIGLVGIVADAYPAAGASMRTMLLAFIAINGTLGAILFRRGLLAVGEAGAEGPGGNGAPAPQPGRPATA